MILLKVNILNIVPKNWIKNIPIIMSSLDNIKKNANVTKQLVNDLKSDLQTVNKEYKNLLIKELKEENKKLLIAVQQAKDRLINLEIQNGIKQIPLPNQQHETIVKATIPETSNEIITSKSEDNTKKETIKSDEGEKPKKKDKVKKIKEPELAELPVDIGRLDLRIAKIEDVQKHPDADTLYVLKINCGEDKPRTVCSGLVKHVAIEELQNKFVVLLCNLKPVKMRGITSEAMVMCASGENGVEVLQPPLQCIPGEPVNCDGYIRRPDAIMNPKKKIFETVAPDLHTNELFQACYKGTPLQITGKGFILSNTLKNVSVK